MYIIAVSGCGAHLRHTDPWACGGQKPANLGHRGSFTSWLPVYLAKVSPGIHLSTNQQGMNEQQGGLCQDCPGPISSKLSTPWHVCLKASRTICRDFRVCLYDFNISSASLQRHQVSKTSWNPVYISLQSQKTVIKWTREAHEPRPALEPLPAD